MNTPRRFTALTLVCALHAGATVAETLETPGYRVTITSNCEEGVVDCDDVSYRSVSRTSGRTLELHGADLTHYCPGDQGDGPGKTPCHHLGYVFFNGKTRYFVGDDGTLEVTDEGNPVLLQRGEWQ